MESGMKNSSPDMDIMDGINRVLSDPESVKQLSELAKMFTQSGGGEQHPASAPQQNASAADIGGILNSLVSTSSPTGENSAAKEEESGGLDAKTLLSVFSAMEKCGKNDKNIDLLLSLKPHLREENQVKIDRLVKIFRLMALYPLLRESGLVGGDILGIK